MIRAIDALNAAAAHQLGCSRGDLLLNPDRNFDRQGYENLVERRAKGEPVAHITGTREFWSLTLKVSPAVLIPRPDTETLVEVALKLCAHPPARILDLGTGSGALLLACLSEWPNATGLGVDASLAALAVAQENAQSTGLAGRANFRLTPTSSLKKSVPLNRPAPCLPATTASTIIAASCRNCPAC